MERAMGIAAKGQEVVWAETYRGHYIATMRDRQSWVVVVDEDVKAGLDFESADEAAAWLRRRVDDRIAEAIFPGLAFAGR